MAAWSMTGARGLMGAVLAAAGFLLGGCGTSTTTAPAGSPSAQAQPAHKPTVFLIGDSTVRNGSLDNGSTAGQFGWGHILHYYFDPAKVTIINDAMGGTSSKSYQESPTLWALVLPKIQPGDYVIMQFGHNDSRSSLRGNGDETAPDTGFRAKPGAVKHSFGWYMRQYIEQTRAKGATPIVCSLIPRNRWASPNKVNRNGEDYALWARQAADQEHADFIPLNDLIADKYDQMGETKVQANLFPPHEAVHTNWTGAILNAQCVVEGIKMLPNCPLKNDLVANPKVPVTPDVIPPAHGELGPEGDRVLNRFGRGRGAPRGGARGAGRGPAGRGAGAPAGATGG